MHANTEQVLLLGNTPMTDGEFPSFVAACKNYNLALDLVDFLGECKEMYAVPMAFPAVGHDTGNVYITSDSTLRARSTRQWMASAAWSRSSVTIS